MIKRDNEQVLRAYEDAKKTFAAYGVDTDQAISEFEQIPISLHARIMRTAISPLFATKIF